MFLRMYMCMCKCMSVYMNRERAWCVMHFIHGIWATCNKFPATNLCSSIRKRKFYSLSLFLYPLRALSLDVMGIFNIWFFFFVRICIYVHVMHFLIITLFLLFFFLFQHTCSYVQQSKKQSVCSTRNNMSFVAKRTTGSVPYLICEESLFLIMFFP